jgi:SseB protein C-terminal domain/SseB protein N-terminal domain
MNNDWGTPQNELESALMRAATDVAARPAFYKALAEAKLLIVPEGDPPPLEHGALKEGANLALAQVDIKGQWHTPVFSSEARLSPGTRYLGIAAIDIFKITKGSHLVLNPGAQYGKILVPEEISQILDGSLFKPDETFTAKKETKVLVGQPREYPHEFVAALKRYFATEPLVEKAFLAQHFIAGVHTEPSLLVSILAPDREFDRIAAAVGVIARETRKPQNTVDVTKFQSGGDDYFSGQEPIYARKKGLLGRLFG